MVVGQVQRVSEIAPGRPVVVKEGRVDNVGWASSDTSGVLKPFKFTTRAPLADEVLLQVLYCGICHTDVHMTRDEWKCTHYPCVPGHEYVGRVVMKGAAVEEVAVGDAVGVGFICDSCGSCEHCKDDRPQHCAKQVDTFSGFTRGEWTTGGYAKYTVVREAFVAKIPADMNLENVAPLLCAGITTYNPIARNNFARGNLKIGVIGMGGIGHLSVQFSKKINATNEVWVISRTASKEALAKQLGAEGMIQLSVAGDVEKYTNYFDYLLDTVSASNKPLKEYMKMLKHMGSMITVGLPPVDEIVPMPVTQLVNKNASIQGSLVGGVKQTREMLEFCNKANVMPMCEHVPLSRVNEAYELMFQSKVLFRFVIDVADSLPTEEECVVA